MTTTKTNPNRTVKYTIDEWISIAGYIEDKELCNPREAFDLLLQDQEYIKAVLNCTIIGLLKPNEQKRLKIKSVEFLYFDAANYTHANGLFSATIEGPFVLVQRIAEAYGIERFGEFSTVQDVDFRREIGELTAAEKYLNDAWTTTCQKLEMLKSEINKISRMN
jgi:hypothetical protein